MQLRAVIERTREIFPMHDAEYFESQKLRRFPNGAKIYFKHLERDKAAEGLMDWSVQMLVFEEAGSRGPQTHLH